jgi:hypothetical protein
LRFLDGGSQQAPPVHTKEAEGQEKGGGEDKERIMDFRIGI